MRINVSSFYENNVNFLIIKMTESWRSSRTKNTEDLTWRSTSSTTTNLERFDSVEFKNKDEIITGTIISETSFDPVTVIIDRNGYDDGYDIKIISKDICKKISNERRKGSLICHPNINLGTPAIFFKHLEDDGIFCVISEFLYDPNESSDVFIGYKFRLKDNSLKEIYLNKFGHAALMFE